MILQVEQEIDRDTFALGKVIHLLLSNTCFRRLLGLYPNTASPKHKVLPSTLPYSLLDQQKLKEHKPNQLKCCYWWHFKHLGMRPETPKSSQVSL